MSRRTQGMMKAALSALHYSGVDSLLSPLTRGVGVIFTLHHVQPEVDEPFQPNRILSITPEFLDAVVRLVVEKGFDVLSLDEMEQRLAEGDFDRPFACFTFDDGYKDNRQFAYPVFRRYGLPFTVYVPTDFPEGRGDLWWLKLEHALRALPIVEVKIDGDRVRIETHSTPQKEAAFDRIYWSLRELPELEARAIVADLCRLHGIDMTKLCSDLIMGWGEIRALATDPLVTIGAHTRRHLALAKLSIGEARQEIGESVHRIESEIGRPCRHFSYPYGDRASAGPREFVLARELGLGTAVTTCKSLLHAHHMNQMTALPRVSLNGEFQKQRYIKTMLTGAPFAIWNTAQRLASRQGESRAMQA